MKTEIRWKDRVPGLELSMLKSWIANDQLAFGCKNENACLQDYEGEEDIRGCSLTVYDPRQRGRGVRLLLKEAQLLELSVELPAARRDTDLLYQLTGEFCCAMGSTDFVQEGLSHTVDELDDLRQQADLINQKKVKEDLKAGSLILGCLVPIRTEENLIMKIEQLEPSQALWTFGRYLDDRQQEERYYATPAFFVQDNKTLARYALGVGVESVFPLYPAMMGKKLSDSDSIAWHVCIMNGEGSRVLLEVPFDLFSKLVQLDAYPRFDEDHVKITVDENILKKLEPCGVEQFGRQLVNWLSTPENLGHCPAETKYVDCVVGEDGQRYYLFRYKSWVLGRWLLAISGPEGCADKQKPYREASAREDAAELIRMLNQGDIGKSKM